jgi:hypothetical protein
MAIGQSKLHEKLRRFRLVQENIAWLNSFDTLTKRQILDWIRYDQLFEKGIDSQGKIIGYYSMQTSRINPKKKFNTPYTMLDTGDLFRSMFVNVFLNEIRIDGNDEKLKDKEWYSKNIIALTDENITKLQAKVKQSYINQLKEILSIN